MPADTTAFGRGLAATLALAGSALIGALATAGCGGAPADKAGGATAPLVLRLGTPNPPDRPESPTIEEFARRVATLSHGSLRVKIVWLAGGGPEVPVAAMVRDGRLDAAFVATRVWDEEGATSLEPLQAPFLIRSQALENRVATSPLATTMLAGLDRAGVTGIALVPAALLHPFGFGRALRAPRDFAGALLRAPQSRMTDRLVRALGARSAPLDADAFNVAVRRGTVAGTEWYLELGATLPTGKGPTTATGNVVFYPKVHSLVVNRAVFGRLTEAQRRVLHRAAADAVRFAIRTNLSERKAGAQFCRNGGAIVASSPAQLAALEQKVAPVYAALERDAGAKRLIAAIRALARRTPPDPPVTPCAAPTASAAGTAAAARIPDGAYRKEITRQQLVAAGVSSFDAAQNYGIHTLTIRGGRWRDATTLRTPCFGPIRYAGALVVFVAECGSATSSVVLRARWALVEGELRFAGLRTAFDRVFWGGRGWRRIG
ncbi:MAG TPA: TRAP transporter substrate-binding protein DctP [Gaiellaceae bacterium]|nr:TRAP transporter substrate-binding protein DctP [Gaiellaceae bacterium]